MIIVFIVLSILAIGIGLWIFDTDEDAGGIIGGFGFICALGSIIVAIVLIAQLANLSVIGDKILMYQDENAKIEEQISEIVNQYQEHEKEIFSEVTPESSIILVSLYPDLKSDSLVQKQIAIYVENNQKIKELKEKEIGAKVIKWWLYFGG